MISSNGKQWSWFTKTGPCGDRSTMFYNPFRKKWVFSIRTLGVLGNSPHGRARYYREHSDFLAGAVWSKADVVFWCNADNKDTPDPEFNLPPELYNLNAVGYEASCWDSTKFYWMKMKLPKQPTDQKLQS